MEKEFIPQEQSLELKELGFDEPCFGYFHQDDYVKPIITNIAKGQFIKNSKACSAPTFSQAFSFFREKYGLDYSINPFYYPETTKIRFRWDYFKFIYHDVPNRRRFESFGSGEATREEAELECLKKLIEIVKNK